LLVIIDILIHLVFLQLTLLIVQEIKLFLLLIILVLNKIISATSAVMGVSIFHIIVLNVKLVTLIELILLIPMDLANVNPDLETALVNLFYVLSVTLLVLLVWLPILLSVHLVSLKIKENCLSHLTYLEM
jgi:hypothetical protein